MIGPDQEKWRKIQQENIGPLDYMRNSDLMSFLFGDGLWVVLGEFMKFVGYFTTPYRHFEIFMQSSRVSKACCNKRRRVFSFCSISGIEAFGITEVK